MTDEPTLLEKKRSGHLSLTCKTTLQEIDNGTQLLILVSDLVHYRLQLRILRTELQIETIL